MQEEKIFAGKVLRLHVCTMEGAEWLEEVPEDTTVEKLKERCLKHVRSGERGLGARGRHRESPELCGAAPGNQHGERGNDRENCPVWKTGFFQRPVNGFQKREGKKK